jgi:hypothetical protein
MTQNDAGFKNNLKVQNVKIKNENEHAIML